MRHPHISCLQHMCCTKNQIFWPQCAREISASFARIHKISFATFYIFLHLWWSKRFTSVFNKCFFLTWSKSNLYLFSVCLWHNDLYISFLICIKHWTISTTDYGLFSLFSFTKSKCWLLISPVCTGEVVDSVHNAYEGLMSPFRLICNVSWWLSGSHGLKNMCIWAYHYIETKQWLANVKLFWWAAVLISYVT